MKKWEYTIHTDRTFKVRHDGADIKQSLNRMGEVGWELISVIKEESNEGNKTYYFKRDWIDYLTDT